MDVTHDVETGRVSVTYVFDPYCGWCYGFEPALAGLLDARAHQIDLEVIAGGLFTGPGVVAIRRLPHVADANTRIAQLTGAHFGPAYKRLLADGAFRMDSIAASRGFAVMRAQHPDRSLQFAAALQTAFYRDGRDLGSLETVTDIADRLDLDVDAARAGLSSRWVGEVVVGDMRRARALGATSFPTLLVTTPAGRTVRLGGPVSATGQLITAFDEALRLILTR